MLPLSRIWVVVYDGSPFAGKPVGELTWKDWLADASAGVASRRVSAPATTTI
jgi:hypothetical protein